MAVLPAMLALAPLFNAFKEPLGNSLTTLAQGFADALRTGAAAKGRAFENIAAGGRDIMGAVADRIRQP